MRRLRTMWIVIAGTLVSVVVFSFVEWPDSLFACLAIWLAVDVSASILRTCDRLLDPPPHIFLVFGCHQKNPDRWLHMP